MKRKNDRWPAIATGVGLAAAAGCAVVLSRKDHPAGDMPQDRQPHILIVGAGFAGLTAAAKLSDSMRGKARISLIDRNNYHLFTPMLYQVATLGVGPYTVAFPTRQFSGPHGVTFHRGLVKGVDFASRKVQLEGYDLEYDYVVLALGTTTNFFGNQSAREHAFPLKRLEDGIAIRNQVLDMLEEAGVTEDQERRKALLTFVVVGGGATGVETAAALSTMLSEVLPADYPRLDGSEARVILVESEGKLLGHMGSHMGKIALDRLHHIGVEVRLNTKAGDVEPGRVSTADGRKIDAQTVIWATGVRVPDVISALEAEHGKGGSLVVDEYLRVCGKPNVYAVGDCAHFEDPSTGRSVPLLAATAVQEGEAVARNIALAIEGEPQEPFHYKDLGNVVALGRFSGAAELHEVAVGGLAGWLAWRTVHLAKITSFRSKLSTLLDWSMGYFYTPNTARPSVEPVPRGSLSGQAKAG